MNPDMMRAIDKYVGVPLCFLLSLVVSFQRLLGFRKPKQGYKPKKILFLELSEMGSTILAYSAMKKAKELFNAELYFMIFKENRASIDLLDIIPEKNVITIRSGNFFVLTFDTLRAIIKTRSLRIDTVVDLELFSRFTSILSFFTGAKAVSGFYKYHMEGLYRGNIQTHRVMYNPHYHISQSFMALVYALLEDPQSSEPMVKRVISMGEIVACSVTSDGKAKGAIYAKLKALNADIDEKSRIVLLNPNASDLLPIRKWPLGNFQKLAAELLKDKQTFIVVTGVEKEKPDADAIVNHVKNDRCLDFTGKTSMPELIDLYNVSDYLITNDSGPAHFSSLTPIKTIVFFGPETPALYKPLSKNCTALYSSMACSPCVSAFNHRKTSCNDNKCLQAISLNQVLKLVRGA
jgi:ADP-heptose:LPS heptosyltransferase